MTCTERYSRRKRREHLDLTDPDVWTGGVLQEETSKQRRWVLRQCIRPICEARRMLLAIMDMSAHSI